MDNHNIKIIIIINNMDNHNIKIIININNMDIYKYINHK